MADQTITGNLTVTGNVNVQGTGGENTFAGTVRHEGTSIHDGETQHNDKTQQVETTWRREHEIHTTDYTVTAADNGKTFHNLGATGTTIYSLPSVANGAVPGMRFEFSDAGGNHVITVDPDSLSHLCDVSLGLKGAGVSISSSGSSSFCFLEVTCLYLVGSAAYWRVSNMRGTWA